MLDTLFIILTIVVGTLSTFLIWKKEKYVLWIPFLSVMLGQLWRLNISSSKIGILAVDLIIPWIVLLWFIKKIFQDRTLPRTSLGHAIYILCGILALSLCITIPFIPFTEVMQGGSYLLRQCAYMLFFFPAYEAVRQIHQEKMLLWTLWTGFIVGVLGILQFIYIPDFTFMAKAEGWDPHIGRLLSTWYDPNFVAGYFAFIIALFTSIYIEKNNKLKNLHVPAILLLLSLCFVLTYSRSGIVALGVSIVIIGVLRARSLLVLGLIGLLLGITFSDRFAERFSGMVNGAMASLTGSLEYDLDITSQERVASWQQIGTIMGDNQLFGIGFNTIKYYKLSKGLVADPNKHSASGSDSSLLNIYMTSGILGLCAFLYFLFCACRMSMILFLHAEKKSLARGFGLGMIASLIALFFHSFFVNSLLYPLFLLVLIPLLALLDHLYQEHLNLTKHRMKS